MASIRIGDIQPAGSALFLDEETFLNELSDEQAGLTHGGATPFIALALAAAAFGYNVGRGDRSK